MKLSETFWLTILGFTQDFFILVCVILFMIAPKQGRRQFGALGLLLIISLITEITAWTGILFFHANMNLAPNIFRLINLPLIVLLYRDQFIRKNRNAITFTLIAAFEVFALTNLFFIQGPHVINSYTSALTSFCIALMSMTYLFANENRMPIDPSVRPPMYWINIAFLLYNCTTLFIYLWVDYFVTVLHSNLISIWSFRNAFGIIFYAILCYALILIRVQYKNIQTAPVTENLV